MKKLIFSILCITSLAFSFSGCNEKPPTEEEPTIPLKLGRQVVSIGYDQPVGKIPIVSGNGGYSIVYPKKIAVTTFKEVVLPPVVTMNPPQEKYYAVDHHDQVDYSKDILDMHIDSDNNIVVELLLDGMRNAGGLFIVQDAKGEKRIFAVQSPGTIGGFGSPDPGGRTFSEIEQSWIDYHDYWQW